MGLGRFTLGCKRAKKKVARDARMAWHASTHSNLGKNARIARGARGASTHSIHSTPRIHRYIGVFMERPLRSSMVNSIVFLDTDTSYA
jgi:hypothetical protein